MTTISIKDRLRTRVIRKLLRWGMDSENRNGKSFITSHYRPKQFERIRTWPEPDCSTDGCAIVMQGPIATRDDFTLNTLRLYQRNMPGATLILSTWAEEDSEQLKKIADLGVTLVINEKPACPGLSNINMQIVSSGAGVRQGMAAGARWILKTRTDQRLYDANVLPFLIGVSQVFSVGGGTAQRKRIIGVGQGSLKFAPYHVTDQTLFGDAIDMLAYWSPPLQDAEVMARWPDSRQSTYLNNSIGDLCREPTAESYLASHFLARMGRVQDWSLIDSWASYRDHFCFVDHGTTDFYWVKVQTDTLREFTRTYENISNRQEMGFLEWMLLYSSQLSPESAARYQYVLQERFTGSLNPP